MWRDFSRRGGWRWRKKFKKSVQKGEMTVRGGKTSKRASRGRESGQKGAFRKGFQKEEFEGVGK